MRERGRRCVALIAQDVSAQRELEMKYIQAEKMSAMGFLAAGIAHELNTPLSVIMGNARLLKKPLMGKPAAAKPLDALERAATRCRTLVESLLAFSRKDDEAPREFSLEEAVSGAVSLVSPAARVRIVEVRHEFKDAPVLVKGHRNRIEQVLINLANNALDAMGEGGKLTFRTALEKREGKPWARVQVVDNGRGIPKAVLPKVLEPFFTTKKAGRGTGLGLSLASEIVAKHGGTLEIDSTVGKGTTVTVMLPAAR
jgi:two-component system, NtrC family, sensor kinase